LYDGVTWSLRKVDQKYLESSEMWYWKSMDNNRTDCVRNEEELSSQRGQEYPTHSKKEVRLHISEENIGGGMQVTVRRGRRSKQLLDDLTETRTHWELEEEILDRTL
jgi:hypothetical protein